MYMPKVSVTRLRPELARWIDHVRRSPTEVVVLTAHGREVAALVSLEALRLIWNAQDERRVGPINPASGRPFGAEWVSRNFGGHYERHRDAAAHLHPSREEAPWLGRPFDWPPVAAPDPEPAERPGGTPTAGRRWLLWRR
jgi:antitoxin (DNA-binding transcriptional repressor) of toxin-antitoxin stability system